MALWWGREERLSMSKGRSAKRSAAEASASDRLLSITSKVGLDVLGLVINGFRVGPALQLDDGVANFSEVAFLGIHSHGVFQDVECVSRHVGEDVAKRHGIADIVGKDRVRGRRDLERVAGEDEVEEAASDSPDISLLRRVPVVGEFVLLWSHVPVASGADFSGPSFMSRKSEIAELEHRSTTSIVHDRHENVFGLDVAMEDASRVTIVDGINESQQHVLDSTRVPGNTTLPDVLVQVPEIAIFENEESILIGFESIDAMNDIIGAGKSGVVIGEDIVKMQFLTIERARFVGRRFGRR